MRYGAMDTGTAKQDTNEMMKESVVVSHHARDIVFLCSLAVGATLRGHCTQYLKTWYSFAAREGNALQVKRKKAAHFFFPQSEAGPGISKEGPGCYCVGSRSPLTWHRSDIHS